MISTIQILLLLLVVVAAVAVVASRLKIPQAILLVLAGVALALVPGLPTFELAPELARLPIQSAPHCAAGGGLCRVYDRRGRGGDPLAVGAPLGGGLLIGRHCF